MSRLSTSVSLLLLVAAWLSASFGITTGFTVSGDVNNMILVRLQWGNTPPTWKGQDPCGSAWDGVSCTGSQITSLFLASMNLTGPMPLEIGYLSALQYLDLSYNPGLGGPISTTLGNLQNLQTLILLGCSFTGRIPPELGNLRKLVTLDVNSNRLSGNIPPPLGNLTKLYWFDITNNSIGGQLPVELKGLVSCGHFHFTLNQFSEPIPPQIFHENMTLKHVLFDGNSFSGEIPSTLGNVSTLQILKFDQNSFEGQIPSSIGQLGKLTQLRLSNNKLNGSIPDLSGLNSLLYLDLSNNSFEVSNVPAWLSVLGSLTTIMMEHSSLNGQLPSEVFSLQQLETVILSNNSIDGSLGIESNVSQQLELIDLRYNNIMGISLGISDNETLLLEGNPVCISNPLISSGPACHTEDLQLVSYQTDIAHCGNYTPCTEDLQAVNPQTCQCATPYVGTMVVRSPSFSSLTNATRFHKLENSLWTQQNLTKGSVYICCMLIDVYGQLNIHVRLFPPLGRKNFQRSEILKIGLAFSNQTYIPPAGFIPYYFKPAVYNFLLEGSKGLSSGAITGIAVGAAVLVLAIIALAIYALRQRRKAAQAVLAANPFASWDVTSRGDSGDVPKLKGTRVYSLQELKLATNNFSMDNEIGSGGYGKVYKGILPVGREMVAVKQAKKESKQGVSEFKNELELLSRVHHKNLTALIGFCFEEGNRLLVYEYMPNGSLRDNLSGKTGIRLDWSKRINIALGAARGLAYLHDHADPPIIHRDVKSTNILLDENLNAKVSDFGLSKLIGEAEIIDHVSTQVKGTMGYLDPEYVNSQRLTKKSDVYSFGVVLMELLASRPPLVERGKYLVQELKTAMDTGGINAVRRQILDPFLRDSLISQTLLQSLVGLSLLCVEESANRPMMKDVVMELESIAESLNAANQNESEAAAPPRGSHHGRYVYAGGISSSSFDYSGEYTVTHSIDPK